MTQQDKQKVIISTTEPTRWELLGGYSPNIYTGEEGFILRIIYATHFLYSLYGHGIYSSITILTAITLLLQQVLGQVPNLPFILIPTPVNFLVPLVATKLSVHPFNSNASALQFKEGGYR